MMSNDLKFGKFKAAYSGLYSEVTVDSIAVGNGDRVGVLFGEQEPIEFVNQVLLGENHPAKEYWNDVILTVKWAKSFADAVNANPAPVYLQGHEDFANGAMRQIPAGYIVGAKVDEEGDGRLLLRNRLFAEGKFSREVIDQTMREINAGVLNTSTGDYEKREWHYDEETEEIKVFAVESLKNQTNAIVERDMNASAASIIASNFKFTPCDADGNDTGAPVEYGEIFKQGEDSMDKKTLLGAIKTMFKDGAVTSTDLVEALGIELVDEDMKAKLATFKEVEALLGDVDVKEFVTNTLKAQDEAKEAAFAALKEEKLKAAFPDEGELRLARHMFSITDGDIDEEIKRIQGHEDMIAEHEAALMRMNYTPSAVAGESADSGEWEA
jgi:hypothetical protein